MTELARAEVVLDGNDGPLQRSLARAQGRMEKAGRRMQAIGKRLSTSVTLPLAAVGAAATKAFADFDQAMTESLAIMGDVSDTMRSQMVEAARDVGRETTIGSTQAAESFFFLASAGLDAQQSIAALPQVAKFAQAGMFDMATATDLATDAQSALGLTVQDSAENMRNLSRVTDVLVRANQLANASVEQFSQALTNRAAAALKSANKDVEEGVAVLAAFADQGVKGLRAGEALARIMRLLSTNAAKNTEEFRRLGLIDTEGNLRNLADVVQILTQELGGLSDTQQAARLEQLGFTARVQQVIKPLLGTADAIREYEDSLRSAQGATEEVADNQLQSFSAQMARARNIVVVAAQEIGETLAPAILKLARLVQGMAEAFSNASPLVQKIIVGMTALAGLSGPVLLFFGQLTLAMQGLTAAVAGLFGALGPAGWLVLGLGALASGAIIGKIRSLGDELERTGTQLERSADATDDLERSLLGIGGGGGGGGGADPETTLEGLGDAAEQTAPPMVELAERLDLLARKREALGQFFEGTTTRMSLLRDTIVRLIEEGVDPASEKIAQLRQQMKLISQAQSASPTGGLAGTGRALQLSGPMQLQGLNQTIEGSGERVFNKLDDVGKLGVQVASRIGDSFSNAFASLVTGTESFAEAFSNMASAVLSMLARMIAQALVFAAVSSFIPGFGQASGVAGGLFGFFQHGGFFSGARPMVVGERGPEVIVPHGAGQVTRNRDMGVGSTASDILASVGPPPRNAPPSTIENDRWWREVFTRLSRDHEERRG